MRFLVGRAVNGALHGLGIGLLVGAVETTAALFSLRLLLSMVERLVLFGAGAVLYGAAGAAMGLGTALVLAPLLGGGERVRTYRKLTGRDVLAPVLGPVAGLTTSGLAGLVAAPTLVDRVRGGSPGTAGLMVALILGSGAAAGVLAWRELHRVDSGERRRTRFPHFAGALLAPMLLAVLAFGGDAGPPGEGADPSRPNVVLVTLDTVRANRLGPYGGRGTARTPVLDALGAEGVVFLQAIAPQPETAPSHATMFTGLHPLSHGLTSNAGTLSTAPPTLAEVLGREGYATGAFVSAYALDGRVGVGRGFETYDDDFSNRVRGLGALSLRQLWVKWVFRFGNPAQVSDLERPAPATNARALAWLDRHRGERFFLWVHYFDAHSPYVPHGLPGFEANGRPGSPSVDHVALLDSRRNEYPQDEVEKLKRLYDEEVTFVDSQVGELLKGLGERGLAEGTLVAVVGDHGESMDDHGIMFSHNGIYDTVVEVPFLLKAPGKLPHRRVDAQVRLVDLMPTLLELAGIPGPERSDGSSLVSLARGAEEGERQALLVGHLQHVGPGLWCGLRSNDWKYIRGPDGTEELYLLGKDPCEQEDVASRQPRAVEAARSGLEAVVGDRCGAAAAESVPSDLDPEVARRLQALGYLQAPTPSGSGARPDRPQARWVCDEPVPPAEPPPGEGGGGPPGGEGTGIATP